MEQNKPQLMANGFSALPAWRQIAIMIGLAASIALGGTLVLWSQEPNYSLLYGNLSERDVSEVMNVLQQENVPYKIDEASGGVLVPSSEIHRIRLKLAGQGLPRGNAVGFELLQKDQGFGTSNFIEQARFQRALEAELARSIMTINTVESARVHLAVPKKTVFIRKQDKPSASVLVDLYPGRSLTRGQVAAVINLVATSVPGLQADQVTVVDQDGNLLNSRREAAANGLTLSSDQLEYTQQVEQRYVQRIEDLLTPVLGRGGVRARVNAELDFTVTEKTLESYNPDMPAIRSEQIMEDSSAGPAGAGGVPGSLSNVPPPAGRVGAAEDGQTAAGAPINSSRRTTRNYELDRTISHTRLATGTVRRLSIAVVLDDKTVIGADGEVTRTPLNDEELARYTRLVKEAVGFDAQRGDTVNVVNASFQQPQAAEPLPEPAIYEQPWVQDLLKQVLGGLAVLLLAILVLRPLMRGLVEKGEAMTAVAHGHAGEGGEETLSLTGGDEETPALTGPESRIEDRMAEAKQVIANDPRLVAQVVKGWISEEE